jgi:glycosyltransferase involved in cell wall biosynthesis
LHSNNSFRDKQNSSMTPALISICIPTYNGRKFLETCLDSAIGQTYPDIEILVVDDGSTDNTPDIVAKYAAKDARVKLFINKKNLGLVSNWNRCIELANGEWIKFLFQDDTLAHNCIEVMVNSISGNDKILTSGRRLILDESLDEATKIYSVNETVTFEQLGIISDSPVYIPPTKIALFIIKNISTNFIGEPTVIMFKKDIVREIGEFNPDLIQICDLEYFLRIACNYGIKYIPKPLTSFRVHKGSASTSNVNERLFSMMNMDPVIMTYQLIYGKYFKQFRQSLDFYQRMKLKLFFKLHVYEAYINSMPENIEKFENAGRKYPEIILFKKGSMLTRFLFRIIKLKRTSKPSTKNGGTVIVE